MGSAVRRLADAGCGSGLPALTTRSGCRAARSSSRPSIWEPRDLGLPDTPPRSLVATPSQLFANVDLFRELPEDAVRRVLAATTTRSLRRGDVLFDERIKLFRTIAEIVIEMAPIGERDGTPDFLGSDRFVILADVQDFPGTDRWGCAANGAGERFRWRLRDVRRLGAKSQ